MVSSVTSTPYSYLGQLQGNHAASIPAPAASNETSNAPANNSAQSLVSSLLGNSNGFGPTILSLLQENGAGSFDPITSLLGGTSINNPLTSIYANLYAGVAAATLTQSKNNNPAQGTITGIGSSQSLLNAQTAASIAYNKTLQQNAANVIKANSYGPDGIAPLVA